MDQCLIAALALVVFSAFMVLAYIFNEERKSRVLIHKPAEHDTIGTRSRRAF